MAQDHLHLVPSMATVYKYLVNILVEVRHSIHSSDHLSLAPARQQRSQSKMKFSLLTSVLALFALGNSAALPTSSSHHVDKRYVLSNTLGVQYNGKTAYMVQVISGVAMSNLLNTCLSNSGADWAQSFVANLADQWDRQGGAATLLHTWGFYATSNTAGLFCTTLAGELVFSTRTAAEQFRQLMVNYLPTKRSLVSGVNEAFDILPPTPPIDANDTLSTRNAGSCSNHCNVNFVSQNTDTCHDSFSSLSNNWVSC